MDGEGECEEARPRLAVGGYELRKGKGEHPCKVDAFPTGSCKDRKSRPNVTRSSEYEGLTGSKLGDRMICAYVCKIGPAP